MRTLLLIVSTGLLLISPVAYVASIVKGNSRPHRLTRLVLCAALLLSFLSALSAGANAGTLLLTGIFALQSVVILGLTMWRGMGGSSLFDWLCFALAIAGLVGWQVSGNAMIGIWFAISADIVAYLPAVVKTWRHPKTEGHWFYTLSAIGTGLTMVTFPLSATSAFQVYIILIDLVMIFCIYHRQIFGKVDPETAV